MARLYGQRVRQLGVTTSDMRAGATSIATECISNVRTVKAFTGEISSVNRFARTVQEAHLLRRRFSMIHCAITQFNTLLFGIGLATMLYIGGREVLSGRMTTGTHTPCIGMWQM